MRRTKKLVVLVLVMVLGVQGINSKIMVSAATENVVSKYATLSFEDGKARCSSGLVGRAGVNKITGTMKLRKITSSGITTIKTWDISVSTKSLSVVKKYAVSKGKYRVVLNVKVYKNGEYESVIVKQTATYS